MLGILFFIPGMSGVINNDVTANTATLSHVSGVSMDVAYEPIVHLNEPTTVSLSMMSVYGNKSQFSIRVGQRLLDRFTISEINPKPLSIRDGLGETIFLFPVVNDNTVLFTFVPTEIGKTAATLQNGTDPPVAFTLTTVR